MQKGLLKQKNIRDASSLQWGTTPKLSRKLQLTCSWRNWSNPVACKSPLMVLNSVPNQSDASSFHVASIDQEHTYIYGVMFVFSNIFQFQWIMFIQSISFQNCQILIKGGFLQVCWTKRFVWFSYPKIYNTNTIHGSGIFTFIWWICMINVWVNIPYMHGAGQSGIAHARSTRKNVTLGTISRQLPRDIASNQFHKSRKWASVRWVCHKWPHKTPT